MALGGVALNFHEFAFVGVFISAPTTWRQISWFGFGDFLEFLQVDFFNPALIISKSLDWLAKACCLILSQLVQKTRLHVLGVSVLFKESELLA